MWACAERWRLAASAALVATFLPGCLPGDTRPEPGSVYVTTTASPAATAGLATPDGWSISFERLLVGLGSVQLEGDGCNPYGEARYTRLFDFARSMDAPQKVGLVYGLGECELELRLRAPQEDGLLGPGVTKADLDFMRVEADDAWVDESEDISVYVLGQATRGALTKRFEWKFRDRYDIEECSPGPDGALGTSLDIAGGQAFEMTIVVDPTELFRESAPPEGEAVAPAAPLRFDALADADANGDDAITLEELDEVPTPAWEGYEGSAEPSIADLIYQRLVGQTTKPAGSGPCKAERDDRR
jgi:hypothetical protein